MVMINSNINKNKLTKLIDIYQIRLSHAQTLPQTHEPSSTSVFTIPSFFSMVLYLFFTFVVCYIEKVRGLENDGFGVDSGKRERLLCAFAIDVCQ